MDRPNENNITGIDAHAHVFLKGLPHIKGSRYSPDYDATPQAYFQCLSSVGFSHGVLVQPSFLGTDNTYLLSVLAAEPKRLRGVAVIDNSYSFDQIVDLKEKGIAGVRLNLIGQPNPTPGDKDFHSLLNKVARAGLHIELHQSCVLLPELVKEILPYNIPIILDHFGRPDLREGIASESINNLLALSAHPNILVKVSGIYRLWQGGVENEEVISALFKAFIEAFSKRRLIAGSDWPHTQFENQVSYKSSLSKIIHLSREYEGAEEILLTNAFNLYGFTGTPLHPK